ncbi:PIN domain-containing protein [Thermococcus waiotapuensis]|uniref:VapC toxin family PIN domain ribonuclease n=1 Tax=Thermococcus waiotapuensis TaxID=90909 RepID=A0AAE4T3A1_9EURY|nr:VapC toxin family PIN domain ribonuclease [Thermococcus waiotapuensis]MDV3103613.1 VapC toxin family PIN domain ribonuclease [Thermococcus waiotapuensis]
MMSFLVDSNVFVEAIKGNPVTESLLSGLFHSIARVFINEVVFSEAFYHYLRLKAGPYWKVKKNPELVKSAPLLPNDALILATLEYYGVGALVSLDSDFAEACEKEGIVLVSSAKDLEESL